MKEGTDLAPLRQRADFQRLWVDTVVKGETRRP
jgi:hypothetical protein